MELATPNSPRLMFSGRFLATNLVRQKPRSEARGDRRGESQAFLIGAWLAGNNGAKGWSEHTKIVDMITHRLKILLESARK